MAIFSLIGIISGSLAKKFRASLVILENLSRASTITENLVLIIGKPLNSFFKIIKNFGGCLRSVKTHKKISQYFSGHIVHYDGNFFSNWNYFRVVSEKISCIVGNTRKFITSINNYREFGVVGNFNKGFINFNGIF